MVTEELNETTTTDNGVAGIEIDTGATKAAEEAIGGVSATIIERLADRIGAQSGVHAVFGEPVEKGGRTVVPVAQTMWGSGAGSGESTVEGSGAGGGGGSMSRPVGYIEVGQDEARFVPLHQPWQDARLILAYAFAFWLVARALRGLIRR